MNFASVFSVGIGAFAGAVLRWLFGIWFNPLLPTLPLGTLAANLLGGFIIGCALGVFTQFQSLSPELRLFITTGFCGGLTTFSTFSAETVTLFLRQQYAWAVATVSVHLLGSLAMTLAGLLLMRILFRA
ncbi:MAG: fluoride efflux transporter CrcB [Xanthomonadales bacterium PRO7]|nr:fluoride efflux transporter CrcB [Xanthomonadales bacterium PRO7]HMM57681.1 fluoride efflux transporter CrcB [Rudaea sp.]